jgi:signal transduction histidine kinase
MQMLIIAIVTIVLVTLAAFIVIPLLLGHIRDVRTIFVRLAVYAGLIIVFCAFYILMFHLIYRYLFKVEATTWEIFFLNGLMIVIFLILFPTINEINYYLNHRFYFDDYDPTFLIRRVTKILATKCDPEDIFRRVSLAVNLALGTTYVGFIIRPDGVNDKVITTTKHAISSKDIALLMSLANTLTEQTVNMDLASDYHSVETALHKHAIAAMVPLKVKSNQQLFGVMLLGPRRHNRTLSPKDLEVINIVSDLLIVELTNIVYSNKVEKFNAELQEKIALSTTKLRRMNRTLLDMGIMKDQFTLIASKQLKLPINVIRGYMDMFAESDFGHISLAQKKIVKDMLVMSEDLMRVVDKFVELLSIDENGGMKISPQQIDLGALIQEEIDKARTNFKDITFTTQIPQLILAVMADKHLIRNVINSMLSNAIRYSLGQNKQILVNVKNRDGKLIFTVTDHGIVPTPSERRKIGRRFYRSRAAQKMYLDGTGVELYLAKNIIEAHGGKMLKRFSGDDASFGFVLPQVAND